MPSSDNSITLAADIVSAFISNNSVPSSEIASLVGDVHTALMRLSHVAEPSLPPEAQKPAVSPRKSVTDEYIVCLEDGRRFKSLKRHLRTHFDLTPEQYREKWGLDADYPMVAPAYAKARSSLAKKMGLGQQRRKR